MQPQTSEEIAYEKLRHIVIHGELPSNEFLSQRMLAERVGVAVVTVRGALRQLENDGLIENVPKWGVRIPIESEELLRDRYFMREVLEVVAVQRMIAQRNPDHAALLREKGEKCDDVAKDDPDNAELFAGLHFDFHHSLAEYSGSRLLVETLDRIHLRSLMSRNAKRVWGRGLTRFQHRQLAEDIFSKSDGEVEQLVKEHIRTGLKYELEAIEQ